MAAKYMFEGHKLVYHLDRVHTYLAEGDAYPLYMEISPQGACNSRCIFCAYDVLGYPDRRLETGRFLTFLDEAAACGVRSILYAGEGEPLLHADIGQFVAKTKEKGMDVGMYTNAQVLSREIAEHILPSLTFLRVSFNGGNRENYARIHRVRPEVFDTVVGNIRDAVAVRDRQNLDVDIGAQFVLLEENLGDIIEAVRLLKDLGINYVAIKPFVQQSEKQHYQMRGGIAQDRLNAVFDEAERYTDARFSVVARRESFLGYGVRGYGHCYGTTFISCMNSAGEIASCLPYWDRQEFVFGSIYEQSFSEIWNGVRRKRIKEHLEKTLDARACPPNCRPNAANEFLWEIKHTKVRHRNFV